MASKTDDAALISSSASDEEWNERLHSICYKHFSHYDEDFQHIQLYWGCLTRLFTQWLQSKNLPVPDWTTTNPRLPAWATILFETDDTRIINHIERREMGGADPTVATLMDNLYNSTFATYFEEAAVATSSTSPSSPAPCPHDLELAFLNYTLHNPAATQTTILYEDTALTAPELLLNSTATHALTLLKNHKLAEDARICPPLTLTIAPSGSRHLTIPWKIFHAFVAAQCDNIHDFGPELAQWLPGALHFRARMDFHYRVEPYRSSSSSSSSSRPPPPPSPSGDEEEDEEDAETETIINPTELISLEISHEGDEEHAAELKEYFDEHIRPYLEEREVFVEHLRPEERGVWQGRAPCEIDEEGNVTRPRMLGVLNGIEHLVMAERAGEVQ